MSSPTPSYPQPSEPHPEESVQQPVDLATIVSSVKKELGVVNPHKETNDVPERNQSRVEDFLRSRPIRVSSAGITLEPDPEYLALSTRLEPLREDFVFLDAPDDEPPPSQTTLEVETAIQDNEIITPDPLDESSKKATDFTKSIVEAAVPHAQVRSTVDPGTVSASMRKEDRTELRPLPKTPLPPLAGASRTRITRPSQPVRRLPSLTVLTWIVTVLVIFSMLYYLYDDGALNSLLPDALQRHNPRIPPSHQIHH